MAIDRQTIIKGPAFVSYDSASLHAEGTINATLVTEYFEVVSSGFGRNKRRVKDRRVEVTFIPKMWNDLAKILPYAALQIGDVIFGATDKPLVITPRNGAPVTVVNAAITQLPGLTLSAEKPILKQLTFTGLVANNTSPANLDNFFVLGSAATNVALTGYDLTKIPNGRYTGAWNSVTPIYTDAGFDIDFNLELEPDKPDGEATVNYRVKGLDATLKFTPTGMTETAYRTLLGGNVDIGGDPFSGAFAITGPANVSLAGMQLMTGGGFAYGSENRLRELEFMSVRQPASNALPALWTVS